MSSDSAALSKVILARNAKVYVASRSKEKAEAAIERLKHKTGKSDIHYLQLDLSSFESIRKAAEELKEKETKLDVLFNSACVSTCIHLYPPLTLLIVVLCPFP